MTESRLSIHVDRKSEVPLHDQVASQFVFLIATGALRPGTVLPSVRALALRLRIHRNTISRAYQDRVVNLLVEKQAGKRLVVRGLEPETVDDIPDLDGVVDLAIILARRRGYSLRQVHERLLARMRVAPPERILVIAEDAGMQLLLSREARGAIHVHDRFLYSGGTPAQPRARCGSARRESSRTHARDPIPVVARTSSCPHRVFIRGRPAASYSTTLGAIAGGARLGESLLPLAIAARGPAGEDLTIDIGWFGAERPSRAFVHSAGIHGVEAFAGSAIQLQWLDEGLPDIPDDAAIVLIHVINPYGMAWLRRFNENGGDLNRNFLGAGEALATVRLDEPSTIARLNSP